ncbi:polysaccharide deacetylase family protein [Paenibacillus tarimensis]
MIAKLTEVRRTFFPGAAPFVVLLSVSALGACLLIAALLFNDSALPLATPLEPAADSSSVHEETANPAPEQTFSAGDPALEHAAAAPAKPEEAGAAAAGADIGILRPAEPEPPAWPAADPGKLVALTFDDGPDAKYTPQVLDILAEYGVQATFFVVGTQVEKHPDMLQRIMDEGHAIGNHSYGHANLPKLPAGELIEEIEAGGEAIKDVTGQSTRFFRAPYGAVSRTLREQLDQLGLELIGWNVDTRDWAGTTPDTMLDIVRETAKPGSVILMHSFGGKDGKLDNTIEALPAIIEYLTENSFTFVTIDKIQEMEGKNA